MTDLSSRDSTLSRRRLLAGLGALGLAGVTVPALASCSSSSAPSPGTSVDPKKLGAIDIYTWEGYDLQDEMKSWRDSHGVIEAGRDRFPLRRFRQDRYPGALE